MWGRCGDVGAVWRCVCVGKVWSCGGGVDVCVGGRCGGVRVCVKVCDGVCVCVCGKESMRGGIV